MVQAITRRLNHHAVDNDDVDVYASGYLLESTSESVPEPDDDSIKSIYDDYMYQILELFHSEHDENILNVDLQMLQDLIVIVHYKTKYTDSTVFFHKYVGSNL